MTRKWQKVGEVVDAVGSNRKQLYQGKEYDYVFDVDIQDGVPPLKLPYNASGMIISSRLTSLSIILTMVRQKIRMLRHRGSCRVTTCP